VQIGALSVRPESIETAIELNGVAVARNRAAFRWGRRWAVDPVAVEDAAGLTNASPTAMEDESPDELIDRLANELVAYQSSALAGRFRSAVERARTAERAVSPDGDDFTRAVAENLFKVMAYKDEYEVARLLLRPEAREAAETVSGPGARVVWHLHPPALRSMGLRRKLRLGSWARPALVVLRLARRMRGTLADPLRWSTVRRTERAMVGEYLAAVDRLIAGLDAEHLAAAVEIAEMPQQVRGYEHLKMERAAAYRTALARRLDEYARR
jgi:indolepyruvate ferredoxin oxidoreductase